MGKFFPKNYLIPSMFISSKLFFDEVRNINVSVNLTEYYLQIYQLSQKFKENQQAIQIYFDSNIEITEYLQFLAQKKVSTENYLILDSKTENKQQVIKESTRSGQISLIIREYGRGTDYKVYDSIVKKNGGVVIIQTFYSLDKTEEWQIRGRTAR